VGAIRDALAVTSGAAVTIGLQNRFGVEFSCPVWRPYASEVIEMIDRRTCVQGMTALGLFQALAAYAQGPSRHFRIGVLGVGTPEATVAVTLAFEQAMRDLGYVDGGSIAYEYRWARGVANRLPALAVELVQIPVDLIVVGTNAAIAAAQAAKAQSAAEAAQIKADAAAADAARANNRINGLGDFDLIKTVTVPFATGSSTIGPKGKSIIDTAVAKAKGEDKSAWMICVVGFADSQGHSAKNKALSERRANAVIGYLVSKYNLPLQRLVQPFGYGEGEPAADNSTAAGRAANRRVEIRVLSNKGIAGN